MVFTPRLTFPPLREMVSVSCGRREDDESLPLSDLMCVSGESVQELAGELVELGLICEVGVWIETHTHNFIDSSTCTQPPHSSMCYVV